MHAQAPKELPLKDALLLGLVQGPTELLPISSSAHINLLPWLARWDYVKLDPELKKSLEVALHAGTAVALLVGQRRLVAEEIRELNGRRLVFLALSFAPAAAVGLVFERPIERRLGGPTATAAGLVIGSVAMVMADRRPDRRSSRNLDRHRPDWRDGLALGLAQAAALSPGISRNGATLAAARWRGFSREDANHLSRVIALPVIAGASLLKTVRLCRRRVDRNQQLSFGAGVAASLASTLISQRLIRSVERDRALWPYAVYRIALALAVLFRQGSSWQR